MTFLNLVLLPLVGEGEDVDVAEGERELEPVATAEVVVLLFTILLSFPMRALRQVPSHLLRRVGQPKSGHQTQNLVPPQ